MTADELRAMIAEARRPGALFPDVDDVIGCVDVSTAEGLAPPPAIVRAMAILPTFRGQYRRNGLDGFVWNYRAEIPSLIDAFEAIGARATAGLMAEILATIVEQHEGGADPVRAFLDVRAARGAPAFGPWLEVDPIDEVHEAILAFLERHAEAIVAGRWERAATD